MKKNFLQDVIPASQKRSIRDIPLPSHQKQKPQVFKTEVKENPSENFENKNNSKKVPYSFQKNEPSVFEPELLQHAEIEPTIQSHQDSEPRKNISNEHQIPTYKKQKKSYMKKIITGLLLGIFIFAGVLLSRTEAVITIHSKKTSDEVSTVIPIDSKNPLVTKTQLTKSVSKTLTATSEQQVEKQASGRIKIMNSHKETSQELIKNTRFQTPKGLIYRIKDSVVVPGYTLSGSTIVPGTLEVEVFADSAGEEYNTSNTQFTIPGFSGREQFDKITANTVGDINGGFVGVRKVVSEDAKAQAEKELESDLKSQIESTQNQSTEYVLIPDISTLTYGVLQDKADGDSITLTLSATVDGYSFVKKELYSFIGQNTILGAKTTEQFALDDSTIAYVIKDTGVEISGSTIFTWVTDIEQLKKDFAGKKRSEAAKIIATYTSLEKSEAKLSPFWKTKFPSDSSKIQVILSE